MRASVITKRAGLLMALVMITGVTPALATNVARTTTSPLSTHLLNLGQMPSGWTVLKPSSSAGVGCLSKLLEPKGLKQSSSARASFAAPQELPELEEKLATYAVLARTAYADVVSALQACKSVSATVGGKKVAGTVTRLSLSRFGDQSKAFSVSLSTGAARIDEYVLVVKKGTIILGLSEGDIGAPALKQFKALAMKAVAKI